VNLGSVDDATRFRARARQCRDLAKDARDEESRQTLSEMAEELDAEAARIAAEIPTSGASET